MASLHPRATTNNGPIDDAPLLDDSLNTSVTIAAPKDGSPAWLQYEFDQPFTARALSFGAHGRIPVGKILASDDGHTFRAIVTMPGPQGYHGASIRTFAFPATTASFFRIELDAAGLTPAAVIHGGPLVPASSYAITEAIFYSDARVRRWEDKGAFGSLMDVYDVVPTPSAPAAAEISPNDVIDLTIHACVLTARSTGMFRPDTGRSCAWATRLPVRAIDPPSLPAAAMKSTN